MNTVTLSANTSWYLYNFRASTIRQLFDDGYRVVCLSPEDDYSQKLVYDLGCEWRPLPMDNQGSNPVRDAALVYRFWRCYRELRPVAALHFTIKNNVYGTWAARLSGVPAINNVSGLGTAFIHKGLVPMIVRMLYRLSQPLAHRVFCQNEEDYGLLTQNKLVPAARLTLLPGSGVDLERFHPERRKPHAEPFRFLYAGRMLADKGLFELIDAINEINSDGVKCTLGLCGFADAKNVTAIDEAQLRAWGELPGVEWLGPTDQMADVLAQVDCVILPSYREGMPRSLLEAGAMGLPVVTTNVPGCRNIVTDGFNGILCEARDAESLQAAMRSMLALTAEARSQMGTNGRQRVEQHYSEQVVIDRYLDAINSVGQLVEEPPVSALD